MTAKLVPALFTLSVHNGIQQRGMTSESLDIGVMKGGKIKDTIQLNTDYSEDINNKHIVFSHVTFSAF